MAIREITRDDITDIGEIYIQAFHHQPESIKFYKLKNVFWRKCGMSACLILPRTFIYSLTGVSKFISLVDADNYRSQALMKNWEEYLTE